MTLGRRPVAPLGADLLVACWLAAWIVVAILVAHQVSRLRDLSTTVIKAGVAVETTGDALAELRSVPFVGGRVGAVAVQARAAGQSAVVSGRETRDSVDRLAVLLGLVAGAAPTLPVLALYLPQRLGRARARRRAA